MAPVHWAVTRLIRYEEPDDEMFTAEEVPVKLEITESSSTMRTVVPLSWTPLWDEMSFKQHLWMIAAPLDRSAEELTPPEQVSQRQSETWAGPATIVSPVPVERRNRHLRTSVCMEATPKDARLTAESDPELSKMRL